MKHKLVCLALSLCLTLGLAACNSQRNGTTPTPTPSEDTQTASPDPSASPESPENTENTDPKPVILAVSFGSSYNDTRDADIGALEDALAAAYPDYELRRAFTAQTIIDILAERENLEIDNVTQAMERLVADGVREVIVQPTHIIPGYEYDDILSEISAFASSFDSLKMGSCLLATDADYDTFIEVLAEDTAEYNTEGTALVFMGHGTSHDANSVYTTLQEGLTAAGHTNYFIGTVEGAPLVEDVLAQVREGGYDRVVLLPLMIVAGDHATNDMAGDEEDSWKTIFTDAGYEVECVMSGLGRLEGVQQMVIDHAAQAVTVTADVSADGGEGVSLSGPLTGSDIKDGVYEITVETSSSMFKIVGCVLTVENGNMSAVITMSGDGYGKLFMGTGEEALAASESDYIQAVADADGAVTFTVPVEALNTELDCAAWSIKKETWYDRTVVFQADGIGAVALTK